MPSFPRPRPSHTTRDVRAFFEEFAASNQEQHGAADALLDYRVSLLRYYAGWTSSDVVLDLGCGNGHHLRALADEVDRGIGIDVAPAMIEAARAPSGTDNLAFRVDDAEACASIETASVDVVTCVGVLEHVLHPEAVIDQIERVLRPGGRFIILTLNGAFWWYRFADRLGLPTRHLSSDRRLTAEDALHVLKDTSLRGEVDLWSFVPRGDMPALCATACSASEIIGRWMDVPSMRGGLVIYGMRPEPTPSFVPETTWTKRDAAAVHVGNA